MKAKQQGEWLVEMRYKLSVYYRNKLGCKNTVGKHWLDCLLYVMACVWLWDSTNGGGFHLYTYTYVKYMIYEYTAVYVRVCLLYINANL